MSTVSNRHFTLNGEVEVLLLSVSGGGSRGGGGG